MTSNGIAERVFMQQGRKVILSEDLLIGKGGHRDVYINPLNPAQCIKINARAVSDHIREMRYRKSRERRNLPESSLLVKYFGSVETNLGEGFIFERVFDYDGATSKTIEELIKIEMEAREKQKSVREITGSSKKYPMVMDVLLSFREVLFKEIIIIPDMGAFNYMVQMDSPTTWRVRIVDDIGSPTLIPVVYYFDFLGTGHVRRRWIKFIKEIMKLYPGFLSDQEGRKLMDC